MSAVYVLVATAAIAVAIFALQNPDQVTIRFLAWQIERAPLAAVILVSGAAGAIIVSLIGFVQRWQLRSKIRQLETRVRSLEVARPPVHTTEKAQ
ncbi:MAG: LapA family protein [candidate division NC10 bacterium]